MYGIKAACLSLCFYAADLPSLIGEAIAAINRTIIPRLERNLAFLAARSANSVKHLTLSPAPAIIFAYIAACLTPLRFVCETSLVKEILLTCRKYEFLPTISTDDRLVLMNQSASPSIKSHSTHV
jgi:hypothetical protein